MLRFHGGAPLRRVVGDEKGCCHPGSLRRFAGDYGYRNRSAPLAIAECSSGMEGKGDYRYFVAGF